MERHELKFADLLPEAITEPGSISAAYSAFHSYSLGNVIAAWSQCRASGIALGPLATYPRWQSLGRQVRKGARALVLCQPVTVKREREQQDGTAAEDFRTLFVWRAKWFVLSQTDGAMEPAPIATPEWDAVRALAALEIARVDFAHPDGNVQGYARRREVAVSPVAQHPLDTMLHEVAHVVLGHTAEGAELNDSATLTRSEREVEAEAVAYLCASVLGLGGREESRGYVQHWLADGKVGEKSAARIFKAADAILKAGRPADAEVQS